MATQLQIISEELKEDKELQLSNEEVKFELLIEESIQINNPESFKEKLDVLSKSVPYPNPYILASLAERGYAEKQNVDKEDIHGKEVLPDWILLTVGRSVYRAKNGYVGAAYWNANAQQVVIVHRGTHNVGGIYTDLKGSVLNQHVVQINSAITFTDKIIKVIKEVNRKTGSSIQLFITGHSLGAWLAPITAFSAKYLEKKGYYFVASQNSEETGYHASTVIFDGVGCRSMLEKIQDDLMKRHNPSIIDSLDITNYLSAPNIINACRPQVGETFRIFITLSNEDKKVLRTMKNDIIEYIKYTFNIMHKITKIKNVFDPETGEVLKEKGKLRIKKVRDWPLLISKDKEVRYLKEFWNFLKAVVNRIPGVGKAVRKISMFHKENPLYKELDNFFKLADMSNNYDYNNKDTVERQGKNYYGTIRYSTDDLNDDDMKRRSLNVFTKSERRFLEQYKILEKYQGDLPQVEWENNLFDSFRGNEKSMKEVADMLKDYDIKDDFISSSNLQTFIPYIKRMLHLFPVMQEIVETGCKNLSSDICNNFYQVLSTSYLKSIENLLDFKTDTFNLKNFIEVNNHRVLHVVHASATLGVTRINKILVNPNTNYVNKKYQVFLTLDSIFNTGEDIFLSFLQKIQNKYLAVIQCEDLLGCDNQEKKVEKYLENLFEILKKNQNVKVILVTEKVSNLSVLISEYAAKMPFCLEKKNAPLQFEDLTPISQSELLEKSIVIFQGKEVSLGTLVGESDRDALNSTMDEETLLGLVKNEKFVIGKSLISLGQTEHYYINRVLVRKIKVLESVFGEENLPDDLFVVSKIVKDELSSLLSNEGVRYIEENDPDKSKPIRFIILQGGDEEKKFFDLCQEYSTYNIHWIKRESNGDFIWQRSYGVMSGIRRYIENYETDLCESEYSENNTAIKMVDVNDISIFKDKTIVVAAEPGMGKSTAITRLGSHKTHESKWVIRINLVDYKEILENADFSKEDEMMDFLYKGSNSSNNLARNLLRCRMSRSGNVVLFLDGFDEITREGQENVKVLLKKLQVTNVEKVLVSTRLHLRDNLENSLSTFSYTFKPFFENEQEKFLKKFWRKNIKTQTSEEYLNKYIKNLLKFVSESIGDKERKFMGIPLQMKMIAEAFQDGIQEHIVLDPSDVILPKDFDMLKLYDRFIETKYRIYFSKISSNLDLNQVRNKCFTKELNKLHASLAFRLLYPEMEWNIVGKNIPSEEEEQEMKLIGIIQTVNNDIEFTHRTFAEYFMSHFLYKRLKRKVENRQKYEGTLHFLEKELFDSNNEVIKTFLDHRLAEEKILIAALKGKLDDIEIMFLQDNSSIEITDVLGRSALHYACQEGHIEIVNFLFNKEANVTADELGKTPLHYAARYNQDKHIVCTLLKNARSCLNDKDKNNRLPVYYAAEQGNWEIVDRFLMEQDARLDGLDKEKLIFHYTYKNDLQRVQKLIQEIDISVTDNRGNSLLHIAAQNGYLTFVSYLLEKGVDVDIPNKSGTKPICYAAQNKHWETVLFLLRNNANLSCISKEEKNVLFDLSTENSQWDIVKLFMSENNWEVHLNRLDERQKTELLCYLISRTYLRVAELLISNGTEFNIPNREGKKPIQYAAENSHWHIVDQLLCRNADRNDMNEKQKFSLLVHCTKLSKWRIVKLFIAYTNKDFYFCRLYHVLNDKQKVSSLCFLISLGNLDLTRFYIESLLKSKIIHSIDTFNEDGKTFLQIAAQEGQLHIVKYLVDEKRADLQHTGFLAISLAIENHKLEVAKFLIKKLALLDGITLLHAAVKYGTKDIVQGFLRDCANIDAQNQSGNTPLHLAVIENKLGIVECLIEKGANIYLGNKFGQTPISTARNEGFRNIEILLLHLNCQFKELFDAIKKDKLVAVKKNINKDIPVNSKYKHGLTALHVAAREGNFLILKHLVKKGADFRVKDSFGNSALHWATFCSRKDALYTLLPTNNICLVKGTNMGKAAWHHVLVDENKKEEYMSKLETDSKFVEECGEILCSGFGDGPTEGTDDIDSKRQRGQLSIIKHLIETKNADINEKNANGNTIMHLATRAGHLDVLVYFIDEKGVDIDLKNENNSTALHFALNLDIVRYLVNRGSNITIKNNDGDAPLHIASAYGCLEVVKFLILRGASFDVKNGDDNTPLHLAVQNNELNTSKYLTENGADSYLKNKDGKSPKDIAKDRGFIPIEKMLSDYHSRCKELFWAIHKGNLAAVKRCISNNTSVNSIYKYGFAPLHIAAKEGQFEILQYLQKNGADVKRIDQFGNSVMHWASFSSQKLALRKWLLPERIFYVRGNDEGRKAWHCVIVDEDKEEIFLEKSKTGPLDAVDYGEILCSGWGEPNEKDRHLDFNRQKNQLNIFKYLWDIEAVDFTAKNNTGHTILQMVTLVGFLDTVKFLVEKGADVNIRNVNESTPLHFARHEDVARYLVDKGCNINDKNKFGNIPLHLAASYGSLDVIKYYIKRGTFLDMKNNDGETPLHFAVQNNELDIVRFLIEQGADPDIRDKVGKTPQTTAKDGCFTDIENFLSDLHTHCKELFDAIKRGNLNEVIGLTDIEVYVNCKYKYGFTPLHIAARHKKFEILKYLIEKNADFGAKDQFGNTVLHWASFSSLSVVALHLWLPEMSTKRVKGKDRGRAAWHEVLVDEDKMEGFLEKVKTGSLDVADYGEVLLGEWGDPSEQKRNLDSSTQKYLLHVLEYLCDKIEVDLNAKNNQGCSILHMVVELGFFDALKYLVQKGADINIKTDNDSTLLHFSGNRDVASYLVDKGFNINKKNKLGNIPLHYVAFDGLLDVVQYLIGKGSFLYEKNNNGDTPLHFAVENNKLEVVRYLMEQGSDPTITNADGKTPKDLTNEESVIEILKELHIKRIFRR